MNAAGDAEQIDGAPSVAIDNDRASDAPPHDAPNVGDASGLFGWRAWMLAALLAVSFAGVAAHVFSVEWGLLKQWAYRAQMAAMQSSGAAETQVGNASLVKGPLSYAPMALDEAGRRLRAAFEPRWSFPLRGAVVCVLVAFWFAIVSLVGTATTRFVWRAIARDDWNPAMARGLTFPVGLTVTGVAMLILGVAGGLAFWPLVGFIHLLGFFAIIRIALRELRRWRSAKTASPGSSEAGASKAPLGLRLFGGVALMAVVATLLLTFVAALAPATQSDGMRYHLGALSEWMKLGRIEFLESMAFAQFPFLIEMHFLVGQFILGDSVYSGVFAKVVHWSLWFATFGVIAAIVDQLMMQRSMAVRRLGRRIAYLTWAAVPSAGIVAGWSFIDAGIVLFWLAAALAFLRLSDERVSPRARMALVVLLGGILSGLAGTKYTMMPMAVLWSGAAALMVWRRDGLGAATIAFGLLALVGASLGGVWCIKNAIQTGNPFYPLSPGHLFPTPGWNDQAANFLADAMARKGYIGTSDGGAWLAPGWIAWWFVVPHWRSFEAQSLGLLFPALVLTSLGLLAVSATSRRANNAASSGLCRTTVGLVVFMAVAFYLLWAATYLSARLLLPFAAMLCVVPGVLVASSLDSRCSGARTLRWTTIVVAVVAWCASFVYQAHWFVLGQNPSPIGAALNEAATERYLRASLNYYELAQDLNAKANEERWSYHRPYAESAPYTLLVGEHRPYYFDSPVIFSDWFDPPHLDALFGDGDDLADDLRILRATRNVETVAYNPHEFWQYAQVPTLYAQRLRPEARRRVGELLALLHEVAGVDAPGDAPAPRVFTMDELLDVLRSRTESRMLPLNPIPPFDQ